jgi:hypothetical protein
MIGFIGTSLQLQLIITAHILKSFWTTSVWRISHESLTNFLNARVRVRVRVRVTLRLAVYSQSVRLGAELFETHDQNYFSQLNTCDHSLYVISFLPRGLVCRLQLLLALASAFILGSESRGTRQSQSQSYITTDSQSASLFWNKAPIWGLRPDLYYCQTVAGLFIWEALSDERTGLSFTFVAGPRQRSHFRVRVPWDSWPYFILSYDSQGYGGSIRHRLHTRSWDSGRINTLFITATRSEYKSPCRTVNCPLLFGLLSWECLC